MSSNTITVGLESAFNEDKTVPSTSSSDLRESHKDETNSDAPEQFKNKFKANSTKSVNQSNQKKSNVIGTGPVYRGGGIKNSFHGVSYQIKLPMLFIIRGLRQACEFQVATEVEVADKLDDLLLLYDKDEIGFFQAKHKLNEKLKITEEQLLNTESDFGVKKYFNSYNKILNEKELKDVLRGRKVIVIMNTNIGIDESVSNSFEPVTASSTLSDNKILALGTEEERKNYYIIKKGSDLYVKLVHLLEELEQPGANISHPPPRLAENLAKQVLAVANTNKKSINADELFHRYRYWLLANVLEVGKEDIKTQTRYFVTFRDSFLTGSEQNVLDFWKIFYKTYWKQMEKEDPTMKDLLGVKFQVPRSFASPKNNKAKNGQGEVRTFLDRLVFAVEQINETKLGDVIEKEIGDYMGHKDRQSIACKFQFYIQEWAKQKEGRYLTNVDVERQFAIWGYETLNQARIENVKNYNCGFDKKNEVIENLSNFLNSKNDAYTMHDVLCLYYREKLFSKIKACQALETFFEKNIDQQYIFCDIRDLIENENTKKCPVKAFSSQTCNTLFVSLQDCQLNNAEVNILHRLLQVAIERNRKAKQPPSNKQRKRLIISIPENLKSEFIETICFNNQEIKSLSLDDFSNSFSELDEKSKRQLRENGPIKLRGYHITDLLSINELDLCMRDEMLLKFISNELEINDAIVETNQYNEEVQQYYTNRSLLPVIVNRDIEKDTLFHIVREYKPHGNIKNQEVVVVSSDEKLFDYFRKMYDNVHWLKERNKKYCWTTSQGTLTNLRKYVAEQDPVFDSDSDIDLGSDIDSDSDLDVYRDSDSETDLKRLLKKPNIYVPVTNISDVKNDVVLISASPGMGKSILLSRMVEQSKKENDPFVVLKTNLTDTIDKLESLNAEENVTLEQTIHFLFICTQVESSQCEESESAFNLLTVQKDGSIAFSPNARFRPSELLRAMVFCNLYNKEKIVLLLDGFDEIAPDYCKTTLKLVKTLKHSKVRKMWITTRPYAITKDLERYLETFAYTFKPLSKTEQLTFFENFWKHKIKSRHTDIQPFLKNFLASLNMNTFSILHKKHKKQNSNKSIESFMGVPLHCYMLAKVLTKDFTEFCSQNIDDAPAITSMTIFDLHSKFFDIKFDEILHNENLKNPKNLSLRQQKKIAQSNHGKLALLQIFDKELPAELVPNEDKITLINSVKSGNEKTGIVTEVVGNKPQFVHRTFAEYFAAHHLAEVLMSPEENKRKEAARLLLYNSVTMNLEHYYVLFIYFNYSVASRSKNKEIFEAAMRGNIQRLLEIENLNEIFDPLNRTPMHLIAINLFYVLDKFLGLYKEADLKTTHNYFCNFIRRLSQSMSKCSPDALFKWTPTHYMTISVFDVNEILENSPFLLNYLSDDTPDTLYRTPLMLLTLSNPNNLDDLNHCALLNGIDVNTQDKFGKTTLHYLLETYLRRSAYGDLFGFELELQGVCLLLKLGAYIDIQDNRGETSEDLLNLLFVKLTRHKWKELACGLLLDVQTSNMDDIFLTSWKHINNHVKEYLCSSEGIDDVLSFRTVPIYEKIESEDIKRILKYLLLRQLHTNNMTPILPVPDGEVIALCYLESYGYIKYYDIKESLIAKTDIFTLSNLDDDQRNKIVFLLTETRDVAPILLSKFPHLVDIVDSRGRSALHYAVNNQDDTKVSLLIKSNARVDILDNTGKIPSYIEKSNVLLECNTFDKIKLNFINKLRFEIAEPLVLTMNLYPIQSSIDADFIVHILHRTITIAHLLLSHFPEAVDTQDSIGRTALHYAIGNESGSCVTFLIRSNARVDILDIAGKMPTHIEKSNVLEGNNTSDKEKLNFIDTLSFEIAEPLVLTMNLYPIRTQIDADFIVHVLVNTECIAQVLLSQYPDSVHTKDSKGRTALHHAVENYNESLVTLLIESNARIDILNNAGKTPAHLEKSNVLEGNNTSDKEKLNFIDTLSFEIAEPLVLTMNLYPIRTQIDADFIVHVLGNTECIAQVLLSQYPHSVHTKDSKGRTALHYAVENYNESLVTLLIESNARVDILDNAGKTPAHLEKSTVLEGNNTSDKEKLNFIDTLSFEIAEPLVLTMNLYPIRTQIDADFIVHVLGNTECIAQVLLSQYPDSVHTKDSKGRTALHYAVEKKNKSLVTLLIEINARVDILDNAAKTPAHIEKSNVLEGNNTSDKEKLNFINTLSFEIAEPLVLTMNLYPIRTQIDADFIVHVLGNTECIAQVLLSQYPDSVHTKDSKGRTALHYAVENYNESLVTLLIESNARVDILDNAGKTPVHIDKSNVLLECDTFDEEKLNFINRLTLKVAEPLALTMNLYPIQSPIDADFIVHILRRTITIAHVLLSHYPDAVDTKDSKGRTALHNAVEKQDTTAVCYLIDKNAQVDIADNEGKCPAHLDELDDVANICKLSFIDTLPFVAAKRLVLTMTLVPPLAQFRDELLKYILDECRTIASILWAEYSNLIVKHNCSYFDKSNVSNEIVSRLLDIYCIEDFSDNILKSNEILKLVVELFSSVKSNDLSRVQTVLKRVETYNPTKYKFLARKSNVPKNLVFRCNFQPGRFLLYNRRMFPGLKSTTSILRDETNMATLVINARSKDGGKTALHYAAEIGNAGIVEALLAHGAYYNVPDFHGFTPAQIAKTRANSVVLHLLETVEMLFISLNDDYFWNCGTKEDCFLYPYVFPRDYFIQTDEPEDTLVGIYVIQNLGAEFADNSPDENSLIMKIHQLTNINQFNKNSLNDDF